MSRQERRGRGQPASLTGSSVWPDLPALERTLPANARSWRWPPWVSSSVTASVAYGAGGMDRIVRYRRGWML